jgi:SAM-dependent methyltransferase
VPRPVSQVPAHPPAGPDRQRTQRTERLNVGCGDDVRPGYVNLDVAPLPGVDVVHDLADLPLPFEDSRFTEIVCQDVLEHVDVVAVLRDLHRTLRPQGRLHVRSPHFTSRAVYLDPTHRTAFSVETFEFFVRGGGFTERSYYFDFHFSWIERARITFHRQRYQPWNYVVEPLINFTPGLAAYYESTFLARLFPAANVEVTLVK